MRYATKPRHARSRCIPLNQIQRVEHIHAPAPAHLLGPQTLQFDEFMELGFRHDAGGSEVSGVNEDFATEQRASLRAAVCDLVVVDHVVALQVPRSTVVDFYFRKR